MKGRLGRGDGEEEMRWGNARMKETEDRMRVHGMHHCAQAQECTLHVVIHLLPLSITPLSPI